MECSENRELLLFHLGPVQEFIAQAATLGDLWAGSYLLSSLVWAGLQTVPDSGRNVIFPDLSKDAVRKALEEEKIPTIPNRFLAWVPSGRGRSIAEAVKSAIRRKLDEYVMQLDLDDAMKAAARTQAGQFLQMGWAVLTDPSGRMGDDYGKISRMLAMRRNVREFEPWQDDVPAGPKDFLSGRETALSGGRGAMNLIKEMLAVENGKGRAEVDGRYIAVIAMDGDRMGETLSSFDNEAEHRTFSSSLTEFAAVVKDVMKDHRGELVYDGGDDVLAVVPVKEAIDTARTLREEFCKKVKGGDDRHLTASAGIAVGHSSVPMQDLVQKAHAAESRAKGVYNRDALALSVFKRSGEILEWGCKWDSKALYIYRQLQESLDENLSGRFPYKLAELLQPYGDMKSDMRDVVKLEFMHAWERSSMKALSSDLAEAVGQYFDEVFAESGRPKDFLDLFLCETFIDRPREGEE